MARRKRRIRSQFVEDAFGLGDLGYTLTQTAAPGWLHTGGPRISTTLRREGAAISPTIISPVEEAAPAPAPAPTPAVEIPVAPTTKIIVPVQPTPAPTPVPVFEPVILEPPPPVARAEIRPALREEAIRVIEAPELERVPEPKKEEKGFPWWILAAAAPFVF